MIRIAQNDPATAHAISRELIRGSEDAMREFLAKARRQGKKLLPTLDAAFKDFIIRRDVMKPHGARERWVVVLVHFKGGTGYLTSVAQHNGLFYSNTIAVITSHVLARCLQRSIGSDDLVAATDMLRKYLNALTTLVVENHLNSPEDPLFKVTLIGPEAVLLCERESDLIVVKTFLNPETASDPRLRSESAKLVGTEAVRAEHYTVSQQQGAAL